MTTTAMSKQTIGKYVQYGGYAFLAGAGIVALGHPLILIFLAFGTGAFFLGRSLEKSV